MNKRRLGLLWFITIFLSGCGIGGYWMEGNPSMGRDIKPYLHYWVKEGVTAEQRREDSANCGGSNSDTHPDSVSQQYEQEIKRSNETIFETRKRINQLWRECMEQKGYSYMP